MEEWRRFRNTGYWVSSIGRIRGVRTKGRCLKPNTTKQGRLLVTLRINGIRTYFTVHRVVIEAFLGPSKLHVNHIDGNPQNNELKNLEYCTLRENMAHGVAMGLFCRGESHPRSKLTRSKVKYIRRRYANGESGLKLAKRLGVTRGAIYGVLEGKTWRHVS